jgi:hypothetical protein
MFFWFDDVDKRKKNRCKRGQYRLYLYFANLYSFFMFLFCYSSGIIFFFFDILGRVIDYNDSSSLSNAT